MIIDTLNIVDCPRRMLCPTESEMKIVCKAMPIPKGMPYSELVKNLPLFTQKIVTLEDCERCANKKLPNLRTRIENYARTFKEWCKTGCKTRTEKEVQDIWKICQRCEDLDPDTHHCKECGCPIAINGMPIKNKLKMANTHCGKGLW